MKTIMNVLKITTVVCAAASALATAAVAQTAAATAPPAPVPVWAKGPCPIGFRDSANAYSWQTRVLAARAMTDTVEKRVAMHALVQEALGPETVVHVATNKFPTQPNAADYLPYPVVNFDVNLAGKRDSGSSHFFTTRDHSYVIVGPGSVHERGPVTTQNNTDHERYHVERHAGDSRPVLDGEVEVWTHIFMKTFHADYPYRLLWNPLMSSYENASPAERAISRHQLVNYYKNPPAEVGAACVAQFRAEYEGWIQRRLNDQKLQWRKLIQDLQSSLGVPSQTPAPAGAK